MEEKAPPRILTLEAANALVPRLNAIVGEQLLRRAEIEGRLKALSERLGGTPDSIVVDDADPPELREEKRDLLARMTAYQGGWSALDDIGAVLKDARVGLVDFYGKVDGKLVWLCWRYGEQQVAHYHALDEGFSARKPIGAPMRTRLLN